MFENLFFPWVNGKGVMTTVRSSLVEGGPETSKEGNFWGAGDGWSVHVDQDLMI